MYLFQYSLHLQYTFFITLAMGEELKEVKINIRSLLTSSKKQLSVQELLKDYRESEGQHIPYRKLGFNSIYELLQNFDDVVTVSRLQISILYVCLN